MPLNRKESEIPSEPASIALESILQKRLDESAFVRYMNVKVEHFAFWKNQRICEFASLHFLRRILFDAGVLTLCRQGGWKIDRSRAEYEKLAGLTDELSKIYPEQLSGKSNPLEPLVQIDCGPGNCTAMYEMARPGWIVIGFAPELLYSVEGTLRNCLVDGLNLDAAGREIAYRSNSFHEALTDLEVLSVFEFLLSDKLSDSDKCDLVRPFDMLTDATDISQIERSLMIAAVDFAGQQMARTRPLLKRANTPAGVMLGFLIDELVSRVTIANGMQFWYKFTESVLTELLYQSAEICATIASRIKEDVSGLLTKVASFRDECNKFGAESHEEQVPTVDWFARATETADALRLLGFKCRRYQLLADDDTQLLFAGANELWRWVFFLRQRKKIRRGGADDSGQIAVAFEWLRRPWGIVRANDLEIAFRGLVPGDENDDMPRALTALTKFFQTEIEDFVVADIDFRDAETGIAALSIYIGRRWWLNQLRRTVRFIKVDDSELRDRADLANTIIDSFSAWVYEPANSEELRAIAKRPNHMLDLLRSGRWLGASNKDASSLLSLRQAQRLQKYRDNLDRIISQLFQFDLPDFDLTDHLDVYPPERFFFNKVD